MFKILSHQLITSIDEKMTRKLIMKNLGLELISLLLFSFSKDKKKKNNIIIILIYALHECELKFHVKIPIQPTSMRQSGAVTTLHSLNFDVLRAE